MAENKFDPTVYLLPGVDATNIDLPPQYPSYYSPPFSALPDFYAGKLKFPAPQEAQSDGMKKVRDLWGNVDVGCDVPPDSLLAKGITIGAHHYPDLREVIGRRIDIEDQPVLIIYVQSVNGNKVLPMILKDFTRWRGHEIIPVTENELWNERFEENLPEITRGKGLDTLPTKQTVYCVASGPSLRMNRQELLRIKKDNAVILALNETLGVIPPEIADYYLMVDGNSPSRWWEPYDCSNTTLIAGPWIPHEALKHNWKDVLWITFIGRSRFYDYIREKAPHIRSIVSPGAVGPTQVIISYCFKPQNVVLVGHNYSHECINGTWWQDAGKSVTVEQWNQWVRWREFAVLRSMNGYPVPVPMLYLDSAMNTMGACQLMAETGIRMINATEGGILRQNPHVTVYKDRQVLEQARLADVINELQGA